MPPHDLTTGRSRELPVLRIGQTLIQFPSLEEAVAAVLAPEGRRKLPRLVLLRDAHALMQAERDPLVRAAQEEADFVLPDGLPLVWLARLAGLAGAERVYGPDLLLATCAASGRRRHVFIGGAGDGRLERRLREMFPGIQIAGVLAPHVHEPESADLALCKEVNALEPDLIWVGLGTPKQDLWMAANRVHLEAASLIGVGAAFDFIAGHKPQAPKALRRAGLEWLFRMITEPRRLGPRYLWVVPGFLMLALRFLWTASASAVSRRLPPSSKSSP